MLQRFLRKTVLKSLWFKHSYTFCWSHKPLCQRFDKGVIKLGKVSLCRSCTLVYIGMIVSIFLFTLLFKDLSPIVKYFYIVQFTLTVIFSYPGIYRKIPRELCDLLRFSLGGLIPFTFFILTHGYYGTGLTGSILFVISGIYYRRKRSDLKSYLCRNCDENTGEGICSGYIKQAEHIRAYEEEATEYLMKTGYIPDFKNKG